jgi:butyryl-CoA dehydrogenase
MQCCRYADEEIVLEGEARERASLLLDLLTPVAKSYPSETSIPSTSLAIQCLGGYGYCDDFPVEQYYRDTRIHPIHEGTTGVQGMDLLGRKVRMQNGKAFNLFVEEVQKAIAEGSENETVTPFADTLKGALEELVQVTDTLRARATEGGIAVYLADATLYLEYFSLVAIAWQWLRQVIAAARGLDGQPSKSDRNFYNGKLFSARYFFHYELPKTKGLVTRLMDTDTVTLDMDPAFFQD